MHYFCIKFSKVFWRGDTNSPQTPYPFALYTKFLDPPLFTYDTRCADKTDTLTPRILKQNAVPNLVVRSVIRLFDVYPLVNFSVTLSSAGQPE